MEEKRCLVIDGKQTRIEDLIGREFGRLTVIRFDEERYKENIIKKNNKKTNRIRYYWICKCNCEQNDYVSIDGDRLKSGKTQSCGCLKKERSRSRFNDLTGQKFGRLTVIERDFKKEQSKLKSPKVYWRCLCDCGKYTSVVASNLTKENGTRSCGCLQKEIMKKVCRENAILKNGSLGDWILKNLSENFIELYWSKNNKNSPFELPYACRDKIFIICEKCNKEYSVNTYSFTLDSYRCSDCNKSKGENRIRKFLEENNVDYKTQKEYENLLGVNNGKLSYDFLVNDILIEYQGEFHDGSTGSYKIDDLNKQKEHDRRKREYAKEHNIKLLEIWYWDFDNIEEILKKELNIN